MRLSKGGRPGLKLEIRKDYVIKQLHLALLAGVLTLLLLGVGTVHAIKSLSKADEIKLKQEMKPQNAETSTELIGIFAPGFEAELAEAKAEYTKEYGEDNFQVLAYSGYTLLVPPAKDAGLPDAKAQVDSMLLGQNNGSPEASAQALQIATLREVFGTEGAITYNAVLRAYTDEKGFQYNFQDGELLNKQVGVTAALHAKFEKAYPHLKSGIPRTAAVSNEQAKDETDRVVDKAFASGRASSLKSKVRYVDLGDARVGIVYGDTEVQVMVDQVTGDVIHYSKVK